MNSSRIEILEIQSFGFRPSFALSWPRTVTEIIEKYENIVRKQKSSRISKSFYFFSKDRKETFLSRQSQFFMFGSPIFEIFHFSRSGISAARSGSCSLRFLREDALDVSGPPGAVRPNWASYRCSRLLPQAHLSTW